MTRRWALVDDVTGKVDTTVDLREGATPDVQRVGHSWLEIPLSSPPGGMVVDGVYVPPATRTKPRLVSLRAFFGLFTGAEVADIAALRRANDPEVEYFWTFATLPGIGGNTDIDLGDPATGTGIGMLAQKDSPTLVGQKVLTARRAGEILAGTPPP